MALVSFCVLYNRGMCRMTCGPLRTPCPIPPLTGLTDSSGRLAASQSIGQTCLMDRDAFFAPHRSPTSARDEVRRASSLPCLPAPARKACWLIEAFTR